MTYPCLHINYDDDYGSGSGDDDGDRTNLMFISVISLSCGSSNEMTFDNFTD
jgi:hypothetical protein